MFRIAVLCNRAYFDPATETEEQYRRRSIEESGFHVSRRSGERASRPSIEIGNDGIELEAHHRPALKTSGGKLNNSSRSNHESLRESIELDVGLTEETIDQKTIVGDASETALFRYCNLLSNVKQIKERFPKIFEIPFNSTNKWQLSIHDCVSEIRSFYYYYNNTNLHTEHQEQAQTLAGDQRRSRNSAQEVRSRIR